MKIAVTGHRPLRLNGRENEIRKWISDKLIEYNPEEVFTGMAMGVDQIFAEEAKKLGIPIICCYPYRRDRFHYKEDEINRYAKKILFLSDEYSKKSYWIRDKYMVDNCDLLLSIFDGLKEGGTWITTQYALRMKKDVVFIPNDILNRGE